MIGRSLKAAMSLIIPSVNACGTAAAPINKQYLIIIHNSVIIIQFLIFSMSNPPLFLHYKKDFV